MSSLFPEDQPPPKKTPPVGAQPEAIRLWESAWERTRGGRYLWTAKDAALIARARKMADENLETLAVRVERLLSEEEDAWVARNASPGLLVERWNQLAYQPRPKPKVAPLPVYHPIPGPRIPPPSNLMQIYREAVQRYALRLVKPGATKPPSESEECF